MNTLLLLAGPGKKLQEGVSGELGALFFVVVIVISLNFFFKRQFTQFISFALFAMLVSVFIFKPEFVQSLGADGFMWLFEAYLK